MTEKHKKIFIHAANQVSIQQPLSEDWMEAPIGYDVPLARAIEPTFRDYMAANEVRRMSKITKRAIVTTLATLRTAGVEHPDAIISGTSIGSLDYTERFLNALTENGEQMLSPTYFMQSTHNTVSSALAIFTKTHGYNTTYSHGEISFELALQDAWMQLQLGDISHALVGGFDEMIDSYYELLQKAGYVGQPGMVPCSEVSVSMLLSSKASEDSLCRLAGVCILSATALSKVQDTLTTMLSDAGLTPNDVGAVMTGINGNSQNDAIYNKVCHQLLPAASMLHYKHLFGENYTSPALGTYAAAHCLKRDLIPATLFIERDHPSTPAPQAILLVNQSNSKEISFTLLQKS